MKILEDSVKPTTAAMHLRPSILQVPAIADVYRLMFENGRFCGYKVQFPDGHRCKLTFSEIRELQQQHEA